MKKKIIFSVIFAIVLISLAFFLNSKNKTDYFDRKTLALEPVTSTSTEDIANAKDWENVLSGISQGATNTAVSSTKNYTDSLSALSNTWTGQLSKDFLNQYIELNSANTLNEGTEQDLAQNLASNYQKDMSVTYYYSTDLKTFSSLNIQKIKDYGNIFIATEGVVQKDFYNKYGANLSPLVTAEMFRKIASELAKIEVPEELSLVHLKIINNDYNMYLALKNIAASEQASQRDALKELSWFKVYKDITEAQPKLYTEIAKYFNKNGIIFSNTEEGYSWSSF
ncbi:hypothetical protein IT397_03565 [Candidatus Nomurabacteria bacterium]|nr:hypothetical protein [Candidatus Nomurabacteria bacterium]